MRQIIVDDERLAAAFKRLRWGIRRDPSVTSDDVGQAEALVRLELEADPNMSDVDLYDLTRRAVGLLDRTTRLRDDE